MPLFGRRKPPRSGSPNLVGRKNNALAASGFKITRPMAGNIRRLVMPWQLRAFAYYDMLGEVKYAAQFYSRMLSPLRLYAAELDDDGDWVESENPEAMAALDRIQDPGGGRSGLLSSYGRLMFLAGECYLFVTLNEETGAEQWEMLSADELRVQDGLYIRYKAPSLGAEEYRETPVDTNEEGWEPVEGTAVAYRLWQRHPRYSMLADSTMQGVLDICEELVLLTQAVRARARSRLAGAGILLIDDQISPPPDEPAPDEDPQEDPFLADLTEAMTTPIVDEGAASQIVPLTVRVRPPESGKVSDLMYHLQLIDPTQLYPETGLRMECIKRLAIGLDMPPEELLGLTDSNHWPCSEDTEVFTAERGFVFHDELAAGDVVLSMDHKTGESEWVVLSGVRREHVTALEMVRVETSQIDALTTLDHRWPVLRNGERIWTDGEGLGAADRIIRAVPHKTLPTEATYTDDFVRLVGWFVSEGTCTWPSDRHCQVRIGQSHKANPGRVAEIHDLLSDLFGPASESLQRPVGTPRGATVAAGWREVAEDRGMTLFHLNKTAYAPLLAVMTSPRSKILSNEFVYALTSDQLTLLLETVACGDGEVRDGGGLTINQRDPARLEPLALAAILAGRPVSFSVRETRGGFSPGHQHFLNVPIADLDAPVGNTTREIYTGVIFCPRVPATCSFLARRNGKVFYTGNTAWMVDEQTWKAHGQPKAQQLCDDLTASYFRPYLRQTMGDDARRFAVAYDATAIINHPDRTKDAKDLYDKRAIGKRALREAAGFDEEDAPTKEELAEMVGIATRDSSLAWFGTPAPRGGAVEISPGVIESDKPGGVDGEQAPATGAEVEQAAPAQPGEEKVPPVVGSARVARVLGAVDLALLRAREAAGARIRSAMRARDVTLADEMKQVQNRDLAASLGRERVRGLRVQSERELVAGARELMLDAFSSFGVPADTATVIADMVEKHAARVLYERNPRPLSATFPAYVQGLLSQADDDGVAGTPRRPRPIRPSAAA